MLRHVKDLQCYTIHAIDGDIGRVHEFYFDDQRWVVRYIVVTTSPWLPRRRVLIPAPSLVSVDGKRRQLQVTLRKDQVATSPSFDTEKPVSRQHEGELYWRYGFTGVPLPIGLRRGGDPHLRRTREVMRYTVHQIHERIGEVEDLVMDDDSWAICYLVVDLQEGWSDRKVLLLPRSILAITWEEAAIHVDVSRAILRQAPEYDPKRPIDRDYDARLRDYYDRSRAPRSGPEPQEGLRPGTGSRSAVA
ncbi:MAG TPA: PRC-barrel domain-containing protein [Candidatus Methylomirabilis sp.]|nr:PRC-barrel domain-containing protein [Candidatus Methylomirabilis sp.]